MEIQIHIHQKALEVVRRYKRAIDAYLESNDPVLTSEKIKNRKNLSVARQVTLRDQGQCTFFAVDGERCQEQGWLDTHHIIPKSQGGLIL